MNECIDAWVGASFTPNKRKRAKGKEVAGYTMRPKDEVLFGNVKPLLSRENRKKAYLHLPGSTRRSTTPTAPSRLSHLAAR